MKVEKLLSILLQLTLWIPVVFFSILLSHNAILYFTHGGEYGILPEKALARQDLIWNMCFYVHLPAGIFCLISPLFLFVRKFYKGFLNLHQLIGKLYVWITLILVCPTGMYLALYAKGGLITQAGFMVQGILLGYFTYKGYSSIKKGQKREHLAFMIRSFAVATVVLTFRIYHILFFIWRVPYQDNYAMSQWIGLTGNLLLAEFIIMYSAGKLKINETLNPQIS